MQKQIVKTARQILKNPELARYIARIEWGRARCFMTTDQHVMTEDRHDVCVCIGILTGIFWTFSTSSNPLENALTVNFRDNVHVVRLLSAEIM